MFVMRMRANPRCLLPDVFPRHLKIEMRLQVDPVAVRRTEIRREQNRHLRRDLALLTHDVVDPRERDTKSLGKRVRRKTHGLHELLSKDLACPLDHLKQIRHCLLIRILYSPLRAGHRIARPPATTSDTACGARCDFEQDLAIRSRSSRSGKQTAGDSRQGESARSGFRGFAGYFMEDAGSRDTHYSRQYRTRRSPPNR